MMRLEDAEKHGRELYDKRNNQYNSKQASEYRLRQYCGWGGLPQLFDERFNQYGYQRKQLENMLTNGVVDLALAEDRALFQSV